MSGQVVVTLMAALCVLLPLAWCMPSHTTRPEAAMTRREIIKDFVARVQALIIELIEKLKALSALS